MWPTVSLSVVGTLEAESLKSLRHRTSVKWRLFPPYIIPMPIAEMDYPIAKPIKKTLIDMVTRSDLGYGGIIPELPIAFSAFATQLWNWTPDVTQVRLATDVGVAGTEIMRHLLPADSVVVISSPVYMSFHDWIPESGNRVLDVPLVPHNGTYQLDFLALEQAFAQGASAYLLSNPHNPVGMVYSHADLHRLAELAKAHNVLVISDEIHGALVYSESSFVPFLSVSSTAREIGVCITSASKVFNLAGLKCALIVSASENMMNALSALPVTMQQGASILGSWAGVTAFTECREWRASLIKSLDRNRKYLAKLLDKYFPEAHYAIPDATYLAWIDFSAYGHPDPAVFFRENANVALNSGIEFGALYAHFVRLNFATRPSTIKKAIKAMAKAQKKLSS